MVGKCNARLDVIVCGGDVDGEVHGDGWNGSWKIIGGKNNTEGKQKTMKECDVGPFRRYNEVGISVVVAHILAVKLNEIALKGVYTLDKEMRLGEVSQGEVYPGANSDELAGFCGD